MSGHQAQVPPVAREYFRRLGVHDHPIITHVYTPGTPKGWRATNYRKRVSGAWARKLATEGVTHVRLDAGGHRAEFSIRELQKRSGYAARAPL